MEFNPAIVYHLFEATDVDLILALPLRWLSLMLLGSYAVSPDRQL